VSSNDKDVEGEELDYWSTTDDPTQFRAYIQDVHTGRFIPGVKVTALRSKVMTKSDAKGLFTLEVAASWRKGKAPPEATETLVFSKPGYRQLRYERLVLNPGADGLDVILEKGTRHSSSQERFGSQLVGSILGHPPFLVPENGLGIYTSASCRFFAGRGG
jgi:hypothetical protein